MKKFIVLCAATTFAAARTVDPKYVGATSLYGMTTDYAANTAVDAVGTTQTEELVSIDTRTNRAENIENHAFPTMHNAPTYDNKLNQARGGLSPGAAAKFAALRAGDASYVPARECSAITCSHETHQIGPDGPDADKRWTSVRVTHSCKSASVDNDTPTKRSLYCQETKCQRGHWCAVEVNGDCSCIERFPYERIAFCSEQDGPTCGKCDDGFTLSDNTCKRHGGYENWSSWSTCSQACGGGTQVRTRTLCNNPEPANGGDQCTGATVEEQNCNTHACCVPNWTDPGCSPSCDSSCTSTESDGCGNTRTGKTFYGSACCVPTWTDGGCSPSCGSSCTSTESDGCGNTRTGKTYFGGACPTPAPPPPAPPSGGCISCVTPSAPWTDKLDLGFNADMTCFTATKQSSELCATDASILIQTSAGWVTMENLAVGTQTAKFGRVTAVTQKSQPACSYIFNSIEHGITDRDFAKWCPDFAWDSPTIAGVDGILQTMRNDHSNKDVMHNLLRGNSKMYAAAREICDMLTACSAAPASKRSCLDVKFASLSKRMQAYQASLGLNNVAASSEHALSGLQSLLK